MRAAEKQNWIVCSIIIIVEAQRREFRNISLGELGQCLVQVIFELGFD